jgi:HD superfamily phosphohydrolase YqeK
MNNKFRYLDPDQALLLDLNYFICKNIPTWEYKMKHIQLVRDYALLLNDRMHFHLDRKKLVYCALAHDILKEKSLDPKLENQVIWRGHVIPQDTTRYVRSNLDTLEKFKLDDYFNTSIQYHPLSGAIFLNKEFGIEDPYIIYPVAFHACPIIPIYETLPLKLNYSLGLYLARVIGNGKSEEKYGLESVQYYFNRLKVDNPIVSEVSSIKDLGGNKAWPERKSKALMIH